MTKTEIAHATIAVTAGFALGRHLKNRRIRKMKNAESAAETRKQIRAILTAGEIVIERARAGEYKSPAEVDTALEFEIIAARFND